MIFNEASRPRESRNIIKSLEHGFRVNSQFIVIMYTGYLTKRILALLALYSIDRFETLQIL